jgi:hypothetical protein
VYSYGVEEVFAEIGGQLGLFIGEVYINDSLPCLSSFLVDERVKKWLRKISK